MRRSKWEKLWLGVFVLSVVFLGMCLLAYVGLPTHAQPTTAEILSDRYSPPLVVQDAEAIAVCAFADLHVVFWSGLFASVLEFGFQRRKRTGEMMRYYLRERDVVSDRNGGPVDL